MTVNYTTYGEIMKIHGSSKEPESIIITNEDYVEFYKRKKYISAKLLTYFVEHPLFFIGYSINDENIKAILSDIDEIIAPNNALIRIFIWFPLVQNVKVQVHTRKRF